MVFTRLKVMEQVGNYITKNKDFHLNVKVFILNNIIYNEINTDGILICNHK